MTTRRSRPEASRSRMSPWRAAIGAAALLALAACSSEESTSAADSVPPEGSEVAVFAGGCFWCMEPPFDKLEGVFTTTSGYTGGDTVDPSYEEVTAGHSGHAEAVQVIYDPAKVTYEELLHVFWRNIDPLDANGQFCDRGSSYRPAIFVLDEDQRQAAESSKAALAESGRFGRPIASEIVEAGPFYPAEDYHQNYAKRNGFSYSLYRAGCGRDQRLNELWGEESGGH